MRESDRAPLAEREAAEPRHDQAEREQSEADLRERDQESNPLLALQRGVGNRALGQVLAKAQRKLAVGHVADPAELEADRVAAQVVAALGGGHTTSCGSGCSHDAGADAGAEPAVRRKIGAEGGALDQADEQTLTAATRGGDALPERTRTEMEGAFGADFGGVKVHTDATAAALAGSMSARAFTVGAHIFLGKGETTSGRSLMAHELTHTIQQS